MTVAHHPHPSVAATVRIAPTLTGQRVLSEPAALLCNHAPGAMA